MTSFEGFGLHKTLDQSLASMGFDTPTPIQKNAIPLALEGKDVLGSAQTGTGKTAAFAIPLVNKILNSDDSMALVLTPTRELARQVIDTVHQLLGQKSPVKTAFIIGGESIGKQLDKLRQKPRIIVGTPGRVNDHLRRKSLKLETADMLVLDETDRMLDMGFGVQLDAIIEYMPHERQTLMFSATVPAEIERLSKKYLKNPERIEMGEANQTAENVTHDFMRIDDAAKYDELRVQLECRQGSVIIFMKTKYSTEKLVKKLANDGYTADALHGDLKQSRRDRVLKNFRNNKYRVLVATDVAARGLDVPHIEHVINYNLPQVAEDYIHRVGRTARAGATGSALSFVSPQEQRLWRAIEIMLNPDMKKSHFDNDNGPKKKGRGKGKGKSGGNPYVKTKGGKNQRFHRKNKDENSNAAGEGKGEFKPKSRRTKNFQDKPRTDKPKSSSDQQDKPKSFSKGYKGKGGNTSFVKKKEGFKKSGKPAQGNFKGRGKPSGKSGGKPQGQKSGFKKTHKAG